MPCESKRVGLGCVLGEDHEDAWHTDGLGNYWREPADLPKVG